MNETVDLTERGSLESRIVGALRDAIFAHGPITRDNAKSAAKRVIGSIKDFNHSLQQKKLRNNNAKIVSE